MLLRAEAYFCVAATSARTDAISKASSKRVSVSRTRMLLFRPCTCNTKIFNTIPRPKDMLLVFQQNEQTQQNQKRCFVMPTAGTVAGVKGPTKPAWLSRQTHVQPIEPGYGSTVGIGCTLQPKKSELFAGHMIPTCDLGQMCFKYHGVGSGRVRTGNFQTLTGRIGPPLSDSA